MTVSKTTFRTFHNVSDSSRPMSVWDAAIYNFLAMGVIFPWTYLWGPASFPGGNVELAIFLTFIAQLPISLAYCMLATVLPMSGGDYIYQTRAFGKFGFILVMSGFVIWILQWIALSGWLFATLGLAPLLLSLGVYWHVPALTALGVSVQTPIGIFVTSLLLALFTTIFLTYGMRLYVRVQKLLFVATLLSVAVVIFVFMTRGSSFAPRLDQFVAEAVQQLQLSLPAGLGSHFSAFLQEDVAKTGFNLTPSFSFLATLGMIPIAWTSLQWATYSVEQNTEIAEADRFKKQFLMLVVSALAVAAVLMAIAHVEHSNISHQFVLAASAAYWNGAASPETVKFVKTVVQPFPNVLAMFASGSGILAIVIALGFIANAFQVTCNSFIGVSRILVAMSNDGLVPQELGLNIVDPIKHAPVRALWAYFLACVPWIALYNFVPAWSTYSLGVTFACGYVFAFSALAATKIPTKMVDAWRSSDLSNFHPLFIKFVGYLGFMFGFAMVLSYLLLPKLGITGTIPNFIVASIVAVSYLIYIIARSRSKLVDEAFSTTPKEVEQFYRGDSD